VFSSFIGNTLAFKRLQVGDIRLVTILGFIRSYSKVIIRGKHVNVSLGFNKV